MRMTRLHAPTLKETSKDVEVISHKYLLRGGYIRQVAAGIYDLLPLGLRVVRKIQEIIREELDDSGCQEVLMPAVQPAELWKESGRWDFYGPELLRFQDRRKGDFCLGPTHEEVITDLARRDVRSYRQMPLNFYQIQTKFRDEIRPRAGLLRGREFIMKDGYSFDVSVEKSHETYHRMYDAYNRIFTRCGLDFRPVEADTGSIGGTLSHEFQVLAESGEDHIASCSKCGYTANVEKAEVAVADAYTGGEVAAIEKVATPNAKTIAEVAAFLKTDEKRVIKTLIFEVDGALVAVLSRGDFEINEIAVKLATDAQKIGLASEDKVRAAVGASLGAVGPVGLKGIQIIADPSIRALRNAVVGANEDGAHLVNVDVERDIQVDLWYDVRLASAGDACGRCGSPFRLFKGIEVGQVFYLGTKYSEPMRATFLDEDGVEKPMVMGCYGIGVTRVMASAIEQNHDAHGPVWPLSLAPYAVQILPLQMNKPEVVEAAERVYAELQAAGVEVLLDDRDLRAGGKFADADLYGIPLRVQIGARGLESGVVEARTRQSADISEIPLADIKAWVLTRLEELRA